MILLDVSVHLDCLRTKIQQGDFLKLVKGYKQYRLDSTQESECMCLCTCFCVCTEENVCYIYVCVCFCVCVNENVSYIYVCVCV